MAHDTAETNQNCACSIPDSFQPKGQSCFHGNTLWQLRPSGDYGGRGCGGTDSSGQGGHRPAVDPTQRGSARALGGPSPLHSCPVLSPLVGVLGRKEGSPKGKAVLLNFLYTRDLSKSKYKDKIQNQNPGSTSKSLPRPSVSHGTEYLLIQGERETHTSPYDLILTSSGFHIDSQFSSFAWR